MLDLNDFFKPAYEIIDHECWSSGDLILDGIKSSCKTNNDGLQHCRACFGRNKNAESHMYASLSNDFIGNYTYGCLNVNFGCYLSYRFPIACLWQRYTRYQYAGKYTGILWTFANHFLMFLIAKLAQIACWSSLYFWNSHCFKHFFLRFGFNFDRCGFYMQLFHFLLDLNKPHCFARYIVKSLIKYPKGTDIMERSYWSNIVGM